VRKATEHPIMESHRAHIAVKLLDSLQLQSALDSPMPRGPSFFSLSTAGEGQVVDNSKTLMLVGELLMQSHAGYTSCGMGSVGTDALVRCANHMSHICKSLPLWIRSRRNLLMFSTLSQFSYSFWLCSSSHSVRLCSLSLYVHCLLSLFDFFSV
jgi:hypothetical protein